MLYPMFFMVLLTTMVGAYAVTCRFKSVKSRQVSIKYYQLMQGDAPDIITRTTRCTNNMFEVPTLFYVVCCLNIFFEASDTTAVVLAWLFVIFRSLQALVHLSYNNVIHRMTMFWLAFMCVLALWVHLLLSQTLSV